MSIQRVLVVDDDSLSRDFLTEAVRTLGYQADAAVNGEAALSMLSSREYHLVLSDLRMPGIGGVELVSRLAREHPGLPVVLVTAHGSVETAVEALKIGAVDFLMMPGSPDPMVLVLGRIARARRLEPETAYLRAQVVPAAGVTVISSSKQLA
jgi:DNA-binding NtrC family response regulator